MFSGLSKGVISVSSSKRGVGLAPVELSSDDN